MRVQGAGCVAALLRCRAAWFHSVSLISVDLPEPETPVTQVIRPSGISAVTFLRLLPRAPSMRIRFAGSRAVRRFGTSICWRPER